MKNQLRSNIAVKVKYCSKFDKLILIQNLNKITFNTNPAATLEKSYCIKIVKNEFLLKFTKIPKSIFIKILTKLNKSIFDQFCSKIKTKVILFKTYSETVFNK